MATLGDRLIAFALDCTFLFGASAIVDAWAFMRWGMVDGRELKLTLAALLVAESLNAAIFFRYLWLLEASFGATLGKAIVGIRVVQTTERNPLAALAIRNLLRVVDGLVSTWWAPWLRVARKCIAGLETFAPALS
jgi:uncharacterized RDD family membrane protein YckC